MTDKELEVKLEERRKKRQIGYSSFKNKDKRYNKPYAHKKYEFGEDYIYASIFLRFIALIIDFFVIAFISFPFEFLLKLIVSDNFFLRLGSFSISLIIVVTFWKIKGATPGKMLFGIKVVNEDNFRKISFLRGTIRYLAYIPSTFFLLLGFIWAYYDRKNQGWHDSIAGTIVIVDYTGVTNQDGDDYSI